MIRTERQTNGGAATLELLIAFTLAIILLVGATMVSFTGQSVALDSQLSSHGLYRASEHVASTSVALGSSATVWSALESGQEDESIDPDDNFYDRFRTITDISPCVKFVGSETDWTSEKSKSMGISFGTLVANIASAQALGGGCDPFPPGDWDNPDTFGSFDSNTYGSSAGIKGTGIDIATISGIQYAFISAQHANKDESDLWILDISNPQNPLYINDFDTSGGLSWSPNLEGLNDVKVVGVYAYLARNYKTKQLQVVDVTNPSGALSTTTEVSFDICCGVSQAGSDPQPEVFTYYDGYLYVGLKNTLGPELLVFDITTTPSIPVLTGKIDINFNHNINDMRVQGGYAYLATGYDSGELAIVDMSTLDLNDLTSTSITYVDLPSNRDAQSVYILGSNLFLGRDSSNNASQHDFYVFDISTPVSPTLFDSENINNSNNTAILSIVVQGPLAFIASSKATAEFQVWNVSNPSNIQPHGCVSYNYPANPTRLIYRNNYIFSVIESNDIFRVIHDANGNACN